MNEYSAILLPKHVGAKPGEGKVFCMMKFFLGNKLNQPAEKYPNYHRSDSSASACLYTLNHFQLHVRLPVSGIVKEMQASWFWFTD